LGKERRNGCPVRASVVVPYERNYLLNPAHPDFPKIRFSAPKPFVFDKRLK
jgi:RES domain-containing protein